MNHLIINTSHGGTWYSLIYLFAFVMVNVVFIVKGYKNRHSFINLWLIAAAGMLFCIAGTELIPLSLHDLKVFVQTGIPPRAGEKNVLGGLLGLGGMLMAIAWLREKVYILDYRAVASVLALGLQNIGCFAAGCCFGKPAALPWAVRYDGASQAFFHELQTGAIQAGSMASLPLHPVQLYLVAGSFAAAFVLWKTRNRWHAPLSLLMFSFMLFAGVRFGMEFLRDPVTNQGAGAMVYGIKIFQWRLLAAIALLGLVVALREYRFRRTAADKAVPEASLVRQGSLLLFLLIFSSFFNQLFGFAEKLLLYSSLLVSILLVGWKVFTTFTLPRYRFATLMAVAACCLLMSQAYIPQNPKEKITYTEIGGGLQYSSFYKAIAKNIGQGTDCNGNPFYYAAGPDIWTKHNAYTAGISYSKTENLSTYKRFSYGINAYAGSDQEEGIDSAFSKSLPLFGVHPYFSSDGRWFGISAGLHAGQFHFIDFETKATSKNVGQLVHQMRSMYLIPSLRLRVGSYDKFYFETFITDHFPSSAPLMFASAGFGSGLGETDGRHIGFGYSSSGFYLKSLMPLTENYYLDAFAGYMPGSHSFNVHDSRFNLTLGLHHRFNYKTVAKYREQ